MDQKHCPLVSIIIPVYNVEKYIRRCAVSVFQQTYCNLDIIFVDDCSPDNSISVLINVAEDFPMRKSQMRVISHAYNRGLSAARNTGVEAAKGDYIYFLDSDDAITSNCIEVLVKYACMGGYDFVVGNYYAIGFQSACYVQSEKEIKGKDISHTYFKSEWPDTVWNKLFRADFLKNNHIIFKEGPIPEDIIWTFWTVLKAKKIYILTEKTYKYYYRADSITATQNISRLIYGWTVVLMCMRDLQEKLRNYDVNIEKKIESCEYFLSTLIKRRGGHDSFYFYSILRKMDRRSWLKRLVLSVQYPRTFPYNIFRLLPRKQGWWYYSYYSFLINKLRRYRHIN